MNITLVAPGNVDAVWPYIAEMVSDAVEKHNTDASAGQFWAACRSGEFFLVVAHDEKPVAASFWRFETWKSGPVLSNLMTAGEAHRKDDWFPDMTNFINQMALANGVKKYAWKGPKAWGRMLPESKITTCNFIMEVRA